MITFESITKTFPDGTKAVDDFTAEIKKGELFVLIGPSGCGKTTTLKMINRLIEPSSGSIRIEGADLTRWNLQELRWNIGYVLQQIALFPTMTIEENIAVVPEMRKWSKNQISDRVDELMNMVELDPSVYRRRMPKELSGGQQQRVGVVRALASDPDILIMDEPFSALDPITREQLQKDVKELQSRIQKTIVFVTHDMDEALAIGDRICLMESGRIVQTGTPHELVHHPADDFVRDFIGDRTNEWDTPVKKMMSCKSEHSVNVADLPNSPLYPAPMYIFDSDYHFLGRSREGEIEDHSVTVSPETMLKKAVEYFETSDVDALPVIENGKLIGVLSYKDIVRYMQQFHKESGKESV
ncbi:ABC transporter ATP-binding protein [Salibacterium halotolerans]|uniref:Carnitine transport ATP-binding protein OpuCA n=1 Tax=Salibacterium halotolerans TaxID=1884432 RepID=A0A1I5URG4_9BACI|nr:ABC transporter ATP-binding protein [Salibacterium halotolerans]SFP97800.1 osmoprotectant transport system ATP-binding protein [Salibacterium halotolerans]